MVITWPSSYSISKEWRGSNLYSTNSTPKGRTITPETAEHGDCEEEIRQEGTRFYNCGMNVQHKRTMAPWVIEKAIS